MRDLRDILLFRGDISPFLVHLTRSFDETTASDRLHEILDTGELRAGPTASDARFGGNTLQFTPEERQRLFGATCFTETPLSEVHCLLEIAGRAVNLEPYGIVFSKERLKNRGVSPVLYLNSTTGDVDTLVYALFSLALTHRAQAERLLPLVSVFGRKIQPPGAAERPPGNVDFAWEREWRYPLSLGPLAFDLDDVFCGLCPHEEIDQFEAAFPEIRFVDPRREMKWYATALIQCRQRLDIKHSVV